MRASARCAVPVEDRRNIRCTTLPESPQRYKMGPPDADPFSVMGQDQESRGKTPPPDPLAGKQSDLAEGERDTVEESIRIHEQKHDEQGRSAAENAKDAA